MEIEYIDDMNLAILFPDCFKSKTLTPELKEILFKDIQEGLKDEREDEEYTLLNHKGEGYAGIDNATKRKRK